MKALMIIWLTVLIVIVGGSAYMLHEINGMVVREIEPVTSQQIHDAELSGAIEKTFNPQQAGRNQ